MTTIANENLSLKQNNFKAETINFKSHHSGVKYVVIKNPNPDEDSYATTPYIQKQPSRAREYAKVGALAAAIWGIIESVNAGLTISLIKSRKFNNWITKSPSARFLSALAVPAALIAGVAAVMGAIGYVSDKFSSNSSRHQQDIMRLPANSQY